MSHTKRTGKFIAIEPELRELCAESDLNGYFTHEIVGG
jgi:hypothetical protein